MYMYMRNELHFSLSLSHTPRVLLLSPVVALDEGVLREASSKERVKFLLAERPPLGGVAVTFGTDAALVGGAFGEDLSRCGP